MATLGGVLLLTTSLTQTGWSQTARPPDNTLGFAPTANPSAPPRPRLPNAALAIAPADPQQEPIVRLAPSRDPLGAAQPRRVVPVARATVVAAANPQLDPLLRAAPVGDPQNPARFQQFDPTIAVSDTARFRGGPANGLFGAPNPGILGADPGDLVRCKADGTGRAVVGNDANACLGQLAFVVAPPPLNRERIPRNLPDIPPEDAQQQNAPMQARPAPPPMRTMAKPGRMMPKPTEMAKPGEMVTKPGEMVTKAPEKMMEEDPFEPAGFRRGNFLFKPAVEVSTGFDSNPARLPNGHGSPFVVVGPELLVRSQFDKHQLNADLRAAYTDNTDYQAISHPAADLKVNGRYDVSDTTALNGEARYNLDVDDPATPRFTGRFKTLPLVQNFGGTAGATQTLENFEISAKASVDRVVFQNAQLNNGLTVSNQDRNFNQYAGQTRVTYALTPEFKPFIDATVDKRKRDQPIDVQGRRRDSTGTTVEAGVTLALGDTLTGDVALGYLVRNYEDPLLPRVAGVIADVGVDWKVSKTNTVRFEAKSQVTEANDGVLTAVFRREGKVALEHEFGPQLSGAVKGGYGVDHFTGTIEIDDRYFVAAGLLYKWSRTLQLRADLREEWTRSNMRELDTQATVLTLGARVQY